MKQKEIKALKDLIGKDMIYQKKVVSEGKSLTLDFVRTMPFFNLLQTLGIRSTATPHRPLVSYLSIDATVYTKGLVIKKLENLLKICQENPHLTKQTEFTELAPGDMAIVNDYS